MFLEAAARARGERGEGRAAAKLRLPGADVHQRAPHLNMKSIRALGMSVSGRLMVMSRVSTSDLT